MDNKIKGSTSQGLFWRSLEGIGSQGMNFIVQLVLARILMPEDFGVVAILSIFINLANTFVLSGFSTALLRKKNAQELDFCTVFYVEVGISLLMYAIIFFTAPYIAIFYENSGITAYLRCFSLTIILGAFSSIQTTVLRFRMDFRSSCIANMGGIFVQGVVGIALALLGFGVWSLIISQIAYRFITLFLLVVLAHWVPKFKFSFRIVKELFSYSWKLFVGWLIGTLYADVFSLIIGKAYNEATLGHYTKGQSIPQVVNKTVTQITTAVMFPAISKSQGNGGLVKEQTRKMLSVSAAIIFPIMAGIAAAAEPLVMVILTAKWSMAIPIIQLLCISSAINVVSNANMQTFNAIGRSDVFLRCEIIKRGLTILLVLITVWIDFYLMLLTICFMGVFSLLLNGYYNIKLLKYRVKEQLMDLLPYIAYAVGLFLIVYPTNWLSIGFIWKLLLQILLCAVIYLGSVWFLKKGAFFDLKTAAIHLIKKRKSVQKTQPAQLAQPVQKPTVKEIEAFLYAVDKDFPVAISEKVDLKEYAKKLFDNATFCYEYQNGVIAAMVAGYTHNLTENLAFVSIMATRKEYRGQGFASKQLAKFLEESRKAGAKGVHVYAVESNLPAVATYKKLGFERYAPQGEPRPEDLHLITYFKEKEE